VAEPRDFATFYAATFHSLCAQLSVHTGDLTEAQDVVQEAYTRALARWPTLSTYDDPAAWVRRVAWNIATSRWRRIRRFAEIASRHREEPVVAPEPDRAALQAALAALPVRQRQVVVMHYIADMPVAEIAVAVDAPIGTVKSWLSRARAALSVSLAAEPAAAEGGADV